MALSDFEKNQVIDALDRVDDTLKILIIASIDAFAEWLSTVLYFVYLKVRDGLSRLWNWISSQF